MPKKKPESKSADHLSSALESLRDRPHSQVGLASDDGIERFNYVVCVAEESQEAAERARPGKRRMGFTLSAELCERARNAVWHLGDRLGVNLSSLTEDALAAEIARLEETYNKGKPFPKRKGRLKGRPARRRPHAG